MIPEGTYRARVAATPEWGFTKNEHEVVSLNFRITQGEQEGQHLIWRGYFSPKAEDRTLESLRYCGWKGDDVMDLTLDAEVEIVVAHEEYEGTTRARVRWVNSGTPMSSSTPMTEDQKRMFAARMKSKATQLPQDGNKVAANDDVPW